MELIRFKDIFEGLYQLPSRTPNMGHTDMVYGFIMLLFIGFNRVWHFLYIRTDSMLCSIFHVVKLPFVTTYWRYVDSLGIKKGKPLLEVMSALREWVWHVCEIEYRRIHIDIDTIVETVYGKQQGGRKGHNTKNRAKKGFCPVLGFIEEYDKRADSENLIGEAKREGLAAIVSNKFATNYAYFQIVMLSYNIWRSFKMLVEHSKMEQDQQAEGCKPETVCAENKANCFFSATLVQEIFCTRCLA